MAKLRTSINSLLGAVDSIGSAVTTTVSIVDDAAFLVKAEITSYKTKRLRILKGREKELNHIVADILQGEAAERLQETTKLRMSLNIPSEVWDAEHNRLVKMLEDLD